MQYPVRIYATRPFGIDIQQKKLLYKGKSYLLIINKPNS